MKGIIILAVVLLLANAVLISARKDVDDKSAFYSHVIFGERIGILFGSMEHDKTQLAGSGSVSILWLSDADYWRYRTYAQLNN